MPATQVRFWREVPSRYNLIGRQCGVCKTVYFPPRSVCMKCRRASIGKMADHHLQGDGEVFSFTIVHHPQQDFEMQVPYALALIKLSEGPQLVGQIVDCDVQQVRIGMPVRMVFRKIGRGGHEGVIQYGYKFRPVQQPLDGEK